MFSIKALAYTPCFVGDVPFGSYGTPYFGHYLKADLPSLLDVVNNCFHVRIVLENPIFVTWSVFKLQGM